MSKSRHFDPAASDYDQTRPFLEPIATTGSQTIIDLIGTAAHILHLIPSWREALRELYRMLEPGGQYLNLKTWEAVGKTMRGAMREFWRGWLATTSKPWIDQDHNRQ